MLETSARLLRLLSLFQGRRYWPGAELSSRLEITSRTLRRDVDKLRSLGYPIHSSSGTEGGYQMGAGATMPPLLLDDDEAVAVALGLFYAASGNIAGVEEASVRALAKIDQLLPARLGRRVAALQSAIVLPANTESSVDGRMLSVIAGACRDLASLRFGYRDYGGKTSTRTVEPYRLVNTGRRWYLVAWDSARKDWRTFRVDRIQSRVTTGGRFTQREPPSRDLATYVSRGGSFRGACHARVKVLVSADTLAARLPPGIGLIEAVDDSSCYFEVGAPTFESLAMHLVFLGFDFEIAEPPELLEQVKKLAERYQKAAPISGASPRPRSSRTRRRSATA